jgi:2-iminobutanoate/2-iminopropanoate deaminase
MANDRETVTASDAPKAAGPYSHAVKAAGLVFLSGQVHLDPSTNELVQGSPGEKARRCLDNLKLVAEAAGASLDQAVRIAVYCVDISQFKEMNEAYESYFENDPPARTTIGVAALPMGAEVEMDAILVTG